MLAACDLLHTLTCVRCLWEIQVQSQHCSPCALSQSRLWQPIRCTYGIVTSFAGSQHPIR